MLSLCSKIADVKVAQGQFQKVLSSIEEQFTSWTSLQRHSHELEVDNMINLILSALNWFTLNCDQIP